MLPDYKQTLYAPLRFRHLHVIVVKATYASSGNTITLDTANSSPGVSIARGGTGEFTITCQKGSILHPVGSPIRVLAEAGAGQFADWESISATNGTATFETSTTKGTAADPADGEVIYATLLLGRI